MLFSDCDGNAGASFGYYKDKSIVFLLSDGEIPYRKNAVGNFTLIGVRLKWIAVNTKCRERNE